MPILTIQYEREEFAIAVGALVHFAAQAGEQVSVRRSEHPNAPAAPAQAAAAPVNAPPAKRTGNYGDGVANGGGYGGRRDADTAQAPPQAAPTPNFGEKVCADCGLNTHSTDYKRCFDCAQALKEQYVDCAECDGANQHKRNYPRCYECAQARKAYESAPDENYTGNA